MPWHSFCLFGMVSFSRGNRPPLCFLLSWLATAVSSAQHSALQSLPRGNSAHSLYPGYIHGQFGVSWKTVHSASLWSSRLLQDTTPDAPHPWQPLLHWGPHPTGAQEMSLRTIKTQPKRTLRAPRLFSSDLPPQLGRGIEAGRQRVDWDLNALGIFIQSINRGMRRRKCFQPIIWLFQSHCVQVKQYFCTLVLYSW